jgi:capsular polysaccharide transport system permease protein
VLKKMDKLFSLMVLLPTGIAILYFGIIASPVYISVSSFVVYSPNQRISSSGLAGLLSTLGGSDSTSAADTIHAYIRSWDAAMALNRKYDLYHIYGSDHIDILNRFGGVFHPYHSLIRLWRYYQGMVVDDLNKSDGISTLKVRAYSPADAERMNAFLLSKGQDIVNQLNAGARKKALGYARRDVAHAKRKLRAATLVLADYRNAHQVFNPQAQSGLQLALISRLQGRLIHEEGRLDAVLAHAPHNPQIPILRSSVAALKAQIIREGAGVTGPRNSLASKDKGYERLQVNQLLAEKLLEAAVTSLEQARVTAQKQALYLETISRPNLPDAPQAPKRVEGVLATLIISIMIWGIARIIIGGIREHHNQ